MQKSNFILINMFHKKYRYVENRIYIEKCKNVAKRRSVALRCLAGEVSMHKMKVHWYDRLHSISMGVLLIIADIRIWMTDLNSILRNNEYFLNIQFQWVFYTLNFDPNICSNFFFFVLLVTLVRLLTFVMWSAVRPSLWCGLFSSMESST